jgi:hypothetical protein
MSTKYFNFCVVVIVCFVFVSSCLADVNDLPYAEGQILIRFAPKTGGVQTNTNEQNQILFALTAGEVKESYKIVPGLTLVKLPPNLTVADALVQLKDKNEFLYVEPNWKIQMRSREPNDTYFVNKQLWGLHQFEQNGTKPDADIDAPEALSLSAYGGFSQR